MATHPSSNDLPVHFFTIVLNGEPFIRYHIEAFRNLPFPWHWHIVEGVATLVRDTAWSVADGGVIAPEFHRGGRSKDGTSAYLDALAKDFPAQVTLYRKPPGEMWEGKLEMVQAPMGSLPADCLLWQIDADELWSRTQIEKVREMFCVEPRRSAAWFWSHFFVGPKLVVSSRNCYSQNPGVEWLRVWRYHAGMAWTSHEPPRLTEKHISGLDRDVGTKHPFLHDEMLKQGLVFQHFAYATEEQLAFKESYYGYRNAIKQWRNLQKAKVPLFLADHFLWVKGETTVSSTDALGVEPIATELDGEWKFLSQDKIPLTLPPKWQASPRVIIDGVFFQIAKGGVARVWQNLLREWSGIKFAENVLVLNRSKTAPIFPNIRYRDVPAFDEMNVPGDCKMLQQVCDLEEADLFISTSNTSPLSTPTAYLVHDMIPELLEHDPHVRPWIERTFAILNAVAFIAVSKNSARDLHEVHPHIALDTVRVTYPGVDEVFRPATSKAIQSFRRQHGLKKPYFLIVGGRGNYKNVQHFFKAYSRLTGSEKGEILCVGGRFRLEDELAALVDPKSVFRLDLNDEELAVAYSGATALVYPSLYEGFGLPVLEAMACGCPVITSSVASLPEVAEDAALYADPKDVDALVKALREVQNPSIREALVQKGIARAAIFSWRKMALEIESELRLTVTRMEKEMGHHGPVFHEMRKLILKSYGLSNVSKKRERSFKMKIWGKHRVKVSLYH